MRIGIIKALVYDKEGRYICEALPKPIAARAPIEATDKHKNAREILSRYRNTVTAYIQIQKNKIDKVLIIDKREKTISNSFSIGGVSTYTPNTKEAEDLGELEDETEYKYNPNSEQTAKSWMNAFK